MNDDEEAECQAVPAAIMEAIRNPTNSDMLTEVIWSELQLENLEKPFELPDATGSYESLTNFIQTEIILQSEIMRSNICNKIGMVTRMPKEATAFRKAEKHLTFKLQTNVTGRKLSLPFRCISKEPMRGIFTNYVLVFQKRLRGHDSMENICLAYSNQMRKDGAIFVLGKDVDSRLADLTAGTTIYARPLVNCSMWKTHIRAIVALKEAESVLTSSAVTRQVLRGRIDAGVVKRMEELDLWTNSKSSGERGVNLQDFNTQQQRALALDELTSRGLVLIQGPPGTGKSHLICHGILPQAVTRGERVLVVCNSNVAVDALLLKCLKDIPKLKGKMGRCGWKKSVSDEVVDRGLYLEGDNISAIQDQYGNTPGANSNTLDSVVQAQIGSTQIIFTTIHFASKEKGKADSSNGSYWEFDTLVLDEAAQIEDARLMIILARCPMLKKIILVGDPKQIQPYVPDSLRQRGYGKSTMERVMDKSVEDSSSAQYVMLERQFRMAPQLSSLVSHLYYGNRLQDDTSVLNNGPVAQNVKLKPLLVVNVSGAVMEYNKMHHSYENKAEAGVVKVVYEFLFGARFKKNKALGNESLYTDNVCILTPYNRHKDRLRMGICGIEEDALDSYAGQTFSSTPQTPVKSGSDSRSNRYSSTPLASPKKAQALFGTQDEVDNSTAARVENIDTVDKFQGSQRKVVLISTCVSDNPRRAADRHFINVACSRAQHLLIIIGNFTKALATNPDWQYIKSQAIERGSYIDHKVTVDQSNQADIHEESLIEKLEELLENELLENEPSERPRKKSRTLFAE